MKVLLFAFCITLTGGTVGFGQLNTFYVAPHTTDTSYSTSEPDHYVALNLSVANNNKLLVFLPGTGASPKSYTDFTNLAANLGYHCVGLVYPNAFPSVAGMCDASSDTDCYKNIRQEVCYGTDVSSNVSVDTLNCIVTRLIKLLEYLDVNYPVDGWGQFLNNNQPAWDKITLSGHSQGSGHALYLAKTNVCDRLIMFAGADDYSDYYGQPANWIFMDSKTTVNRFYSLLHLRDDVWDYAKQFAVVKACGMTANGDDSTLTDNLQPPFGHSHCLYTNLTPLYPGIYSAYHNSMVVNLYTPKNTGNTPVLTPVWTYMLTDNGTASHIRSTREPDVNVYPNPATSVIHVSLLNSPDAAWYKIIDVLGNVVIRKEINNYTWQDPLNIDLTGLREGIYFLRVGDLRTVFIKKDL